MHIEWLQPAFSYTFLIVGQVHFLSALLHMVYQRRTPTSMISWLLARQRSQPLQNNFTVQS
ncbi:MAG: hypothetical protein K0A99_06890 [Desulfoarculaceae bacterium]|nr:hypothetical protein [Desulfoarculaceae bacterium]